MRKIRIAVMLAALIISNGLYSSDSRGMGLWQDLDRAVNFKNPKDHATFLRDGDTFPGFNKNLIYGVSKGTPVSWSEYEAQTKEIAATSLQSLFSVLHTVNTATQNGIGKKFGVTIITPEIALAVLESDMVTVGTLPVGDSIVFDTYNKYTHWIGSIKRPPHFLKAAGEWEMFIFVTIDGYEPIPVRSGFCGNNIAPANVVKYIHKKPEQPVTPPAPPAPGPTNQTGGTCLIGGPTNQVGGTCATNNDGPQNVSTIGSQDGPQNISNVKGSNGPSNISNVGQKGPSNQSSVKTTPSSTSTQNTGWKKVETGPVATDYQF